MPAYMTAVDVIMHGHDLYLRQQCTILEWYFLALKRHHGILSFRYAWDSGALSFGYAWDPGKGRTKRLFLRLESVTFWSHGKNFTSYANMLPFDMCEISERAGPRCYFHGSNSWLSGHMVTTLPVTPMLPFDISFVLFYLISFD